MKREDIFEMFVGIGALGLMILSLWLYCSLVTPS